ncbi:hypothetical protein NEOLEDRAFT_1167157 [Neolentinus lepideus HHB14362 ss-1]|uniref:Uncharacterized protein n=1 Tax=Neolentinus lepideus HHB14362 ss-1 TaxID=1314782 RepID=A0A165V4E4_9AGAM|nr:hypothetical protein NEOLEDRAFT_1167157 [Neolentinus lepideus HHB14362 ss-1]
MAGSTTFTVQIDDSSPTVSYLPYPDSSTIPPDLIGGWTPSFSNASLTSLGVVGSGTSLHTTSRDGATLSVYWFGNGIQLFGNTSDAKYDIFLDGRLQVNSSLGSNILAEFSNLANEDHNITLLTQIDTPTAALSFDRADITVSTGLVNATVASVPFDVKSISFAGSWQYQLWPVIPGQLLPFYVSNTAGDTATLNFSGSAITVSGFRNEGSGHYNVTLDGVTTSYDGQSSFTEPALLFYATGLNSSMSHSLTFTNADNRTTAIDSVNITTISGGCRSCGGTGSLSSSRGYPRGTIIGLATASAIAFLILILLIIIFVWRRRRAILHRERCRAMNLKMPWSLKRGRPNFVDIDPDFGSDDGHGIKTPPEALSRPMSYVPFRKSSQMSFTKAGGVPVSPFTSLAQFPRPPREYAPSPRWDSAARYSDVIDITRPMPPPMSSPPGRHHTRDSSRGGLLAFDAQIEEIEGEAMNRERSSPDFPVSVVSRQTREYPTPPQIEHSGDIPFVLSARSNGTRHAYANVRDRTGGGVPDSHLSEDDQRKDEEYLSVGNVSPFRLSFPRTITGRSRPTSQVPPPQVPDVPQVAVEHADPSGSSGMSLRRARDQVFSFLDFSSSSSSSRRHRSEISSYSGVTTRSQPSSLYATEHMPSNRDSLVSQPSQATNRVSLSASVETRPATLGIVTEPTLPNASRRTSRRLSEMNSPTDSVPMSVSDIQFRHPDDGDSDVSPSRRTSGSHRPPHPPLPQSAPTSPFVTPPMIAKKLLGRAPGPPGSTSATSNQARPVGPRPSSAGKSPGYIPGMIRPR